MSSIKLTADSGGGTVELKAPATTTSNAALQFKLPVVDGTSGQALTTNASGQLAFATITGGITMADSWSVTTSFNAQNADFTSNWARAPYTGNTEFGGFGSAMTESSGIFTFPSNGHYYVEATISGYANGGAINNIGLLQKFSTDSGSNYSEALKAYTSGSTDSAHFSITTSEIYDITDYANMRWKMRLESGGTCNIFGTTTGNDGLTGVRFIRLGDT